ncbi:MAG: YkgB family protein [Pyrinomonadaceae bacterium]
MSATAMDRAETHDLAYTLENIGTKVIRYGLVLILVVVGALKFTAYEAEGIQGFVANSPLMSWAYSVFSVRSFAALLGVVEITLGILIATRPIAPRVSAIGSIGAIFMFLITLSFLLTTPGAWQPGYGFPFPSPMPGQFLTKDILSIGAAIWTAGEALRAARMRR